MKDAKAKKRANQSVFAVLGLLSFGAMTGYELRKISEQSIQHFWRESFGQIYPSLRELETLGYATRKKVKSSVPGRPARQVFELTENGHAALREWLAVPAKPDVPRSELLLKIFFGRHTRAEVNLRQIAENRQRLVEELAGYSSTEQQIQAQYQGHPDMPYWLLTLRYGKLCTEAEIAWCDEATAKLLKLEDQEKGGNRDA